MNYGTDNNPLHMTSAQVETLASVYALVENDPERELKITELHVHPYSGVLTLHAGREYVLFISPNGRINPGDALGIAELVNGPDELYR